VSADPRILQVERPSAEGSTYDVHLEPGGLSRLGELCTRAAEAHRYAVITDSQVAHLYGEPALESFREVGAEADLVTFPAGEWNKTRETWQELSDHLLARGFGRDTVVIALGGGVAGDLAGFVAATYMRGLPVVQVPTTLLAMLDSSVGGKTGVDTDAGKNLIGAFHHPSLVLIDPRLLSTLPRHQRAAGLAEGVKTAAILDVELWDWIEGAAESLLDGDELALTTVIERVVRHKVEVVSADPLETDRRAILNFGHTIGHALELLGGYALLHGEAVAAGMRAEARLGERLSVTETGTAERIERLLAACELDEAWEEERRPSDIWRVLTRDKKGREGQVRCVFLQRLGEVACSPDERHTFEIDPDSGEEWLGAALRSASEARD
jgi:3-dehydroquinate synthase